MPQTNTTLISILRETVSGNLQEPVLNLVNELIQDYNCTNAIEKSLCEIIANSYGRIISTSKLIEEDLKLDCPSKEKMQYLQILSKELDRQNRIYLTALNTLLEIKNPSMTINLNSENTIVGQNQQFSTNSSKKGKD